MKVWKTLGWALLAILVVIQFFRPARNTAAVPSANDISTAYAVPAEVSTILGKACNDCHSNNTTYPWYASVQPVAWWLAKHVNDGKRHLNFSEFTAYPLARQFHKLEETVEMVNEKEMPLNSYTIIHTNATLTDAERKLLVNWCESIKDTMRARYPADSLVRKKRP
ncbi:heme-binding domain-containing protein [Chitinophaga alhagiae]|uniref:heme-binding domain-containing protein n=1 Tax=Chitinophaga alhagiae TaxID=2203219 RepID=UPI000E5A154D|nr:heme-binding domain-containing protein [Chitinophaga alhagiae]